MGLGCYGSNPRAPGRDSPQLRFSTFGNNQRSRTHRCCSASRPEKDFLVTERIWFPCRNLEEVKKKPQNKSRSVSDLAGETSRRRCRQNLQLLQLLQSREWPVHVFDGPGDLVLLEVPLETETKMRPHCKNKKK